MKAPPRCSKPIALKIALAFVAMSWSSVTAATSKFCSCVQRLKSQSNLTPPDFSPYQRTTAACLLVAHTLLLANAINAECGLPTSPITLAYSARRSSSTSLPMSGMSSGYSSAANASPAPRMNGSSALCIPLIFNQGSLWCECRSLIGRVGPGREYCILAACATSGIRA